MILESRFPVNVVKASALRGSLLLPFPIKEIGKSPSFSHGYFVWEDAYFFSIKSNQTVG